MIRKFYIDQKWLPVLLPVFSLVMILISICSQENENNISNLIARSVDCGIKLEWRTPSWDWDSYLELTIQSDEQTEIVKLHSGTSSYTYRTGTHGKMYSFNLRLLKSGEQVGETLADSTLFLRFNQLPDVPLVKIETRNGKWPSATYIKAPDGCIGSTITDNAYVDTQMSLEQSGITKVLCDAQIRVRGNTSAYLEKRSYKIKLGSSLDLLNRGGAAYADREYYLIPASEFLRFEAGTKVAEICGLEWQPTFMTVNLMMNGKWLGVYHLTESVKVSQTRVNISDTGFLIERDPYWWKNKDESFQTPLQLSLFAYTYRYPTLEERTEETSALVYDYMVAYESAMLEGVGDLVDYIDVDSFAGWLLAHDILGTYDAAGSNMYLYKYDMDKNDVTSSKLKMGPLWDFDSVFVNSGYATINQEIIFSADSLFANPEFNEAHRKKWDQVSLTVCADVMAFLNTYVNSYGTGLQESWNLDSVAWRCQGVASMVDSLNFVQSWFENKTIWLNDRVPYL